MALELLKEKCDDHLILVGVNKMTEMVGKKKRGVERGVLINRLSCGRSLTIDLRLFIIFIIIILDGDTFEPNKYFARLLKEKPLNGLVKKDNELVTGNERKNTLCFISK